MAQYQEGQYINQFLNTMPQQLLAHSQYKEGQRQFDVSSMERQRQFDASLGQRDRHFDVTSGQRSKEFDSLQELRESLEADRKDDREYGYTQNSLLTLALNSARQQELDQSEAISRKNTALEDMPWYRKAWQDMPWTETREEFAQRSTGYDPEGDRWKPLQYPEGLDLNPSNYDYLSRQSAYKDPKATLLEIMSRGGVR